MSGDASKKKKKGLDVDAGSSPLLTARKTFPAWLLVTSFRYF